MVFMVFHGVCFVFAWCSLSCIWLISLADLVFQMKQCMVLVLQITCPAVLPEALLEEVAKNDEAAEQAWVALRAAQEAHAVVVKMDGQILEAMENEVMEQQAMCREDNQALNSPWWQVVKEKC